MRFLHSTLFILTSLVLGCGPVDGTIPTLPASATECTDKQVSILVGDGFIQNICGCTEARQTITSGQLDCHLSSVPKTVFFNYQGRSPHQIVPSGFAASLYPPSFLYQPGNTVNIPYTVVIDRPSQTFDFHDTFFPAYGILIYSP